MSSSPGRNIERGLPPVVEVSTGVPVDSNDGNDDNDALSLDGEREEGPTNEYVLVSESLEEKHWMLCEFL